MLASQPHYFSFMLVIASVYVHSWRDGLRGSFLPLLCAVVFLCFFVFSPAALCCRVPVYF